MNDPKGKITTICRYLDISRNFGRQVKPMAIFKRIKVTFLKPKKIRD
jgi:hypothetical protein